MEAPSVEASNVTVVVLRNVVGPVVRSSATSYVVDGEQVCALAGFVAGEVLAGHGVS